MGIDTINHAGVRTGKRVASLDEMLVDLHDAQRKYATADAEHAGLTRQRVVQTVGQILESDVSERDREMVADILLSLVRQAEKDLRESLSERLCMMEGVPEDLILFLAHDVINVAKPVLRHSPVLTAQDLLYIIQSKPCEYWQSIAQRKLLDDCVVDALVDRNDEATALNLILNDKIALRTRAVEAFSELSKYSDQIAEPLLRRKELPQRLAMELYWHVSGPLRQKITERFGAQKAKIDLAFADAIEDFQDTAHGVQNPRPSALMQDLAHQYGEKDRITDAILVQTLRRGQIRFFVALMAQRSGLKTDIVQEIMRQIGGQGMAVACKAMEVKKENFVSIFLLSRSLARGDIAVDALELRKAIKYYDALSADLAASILADSIINGKA
ncbi:MAG: DUF2336 domain-containing protein [Alphaproteobacteria bacterium]|nr:DUF2336 domain-containing protein [Alphaproteobacteria bacterium]USO07468.1 MAG: DUF2336 domain-containing protein [Rhodospirillales bacterium]